MAQHLPTHLTHTRIGRVLWFLRRFTSEGWVFQPKEWAHLHTEHAGRQRVCAGLDSTANVFQQREDTHERDQLHDA
jgi:hypothetical protein